jgi:hypothetical protein
LERENFSMRFFSRILTRKARPAVLVGCWHLERTEDAQLDLGAEIEFLPHGKARYSIPTTDRWQIMPRLVRRGPVHRY